MKLAFFSFTFLLLSRASYSWHNISCVRNSNEYAFWQFSVPIFWKRRNSRLCVYVHNILQLKEICLVKSSSYLKCNYISEHSWQPLSLSAVHAVFKLFYNQLNRERLSSETKHCTLLINSIKDILEMYPTHRHNYSALNFPRCLSTKIHTDQMEALAGFNYSTLCRPPSKLWHAPTLWVCIRNINAHINFVLTFPRPFSVLQSKHRERPFFNSLVWRETQLGSQSVVAAG